MFFLYWAGNFSYCMIYFYKIYSVSLRFFFSLVLILNFLLLLKYFCIFLSYLLILNLSIFRRVFFVSDLLPVILFFLLFLTVFIFNSLEVADCFHSEAIELYFGLTISSLSVLLIIPIFFIMLSELSLPLCFFHYLLLYR